MLKRVPSECNLAVAKNVTKNLEYNRIMVCDVPAPLHRGEQISWDIELEYTFNGKEEELAIEAILEDSLYNRNITGEALQEIFIAVTPNADFGISG